jgi:hypothetical protein
LAERVELRAAEGERRANVVPLLARLLRRLRDRERAEAVSCGPKTDVEK